MFVADARRPRFIETSGREDDRIEARMLAQAGRHVGRGVVGSLTGTALTRLL